jgi:hypothetical protein
MKREVRWGSIRHAITDVAVLYSRAIAADYQYISRGS